MYYECTKFGKEKSPVRRAVALRGLIVRNNAFRGSASVRDVDEHELSGAIFRGQRVH